MSDPPNDKDPIAAPVGPDEARSRATPRWVKVFGVGSLGLVLVIAVAAVSGLGGEHGPGRHTGPPGARPSPDAANAQPAGGHQAPVHGPEPTASAPT